MRIITLEDFKDIYVKFHQRGLHFLASKLKIDAYKRTQSAFNSNHIEVANYWMIPEIKKRWNLLITNNKEITYEEYLSTHFFNEMPQTKILAIGSGVCSHEIKLAELNKNLEIHCYDFSDNLLNTARKIAADKKLSNIFFHAENVAAFPFPSEEYDVVFFHMALHHFDEIPNFIKNVVVKTLKKNGHLVINEYVGKNRLQYTKAQIIAINNALKVIPKKYKQIFKTNIFKKKYYGSGVLRMYIADPSECVDSENILPTIKNYFSPIVEKPYGNNLLDNTFKDIAHHFMVLDNEKKEIITLIFDLEDQFLENNPSDFLFGIYQLKN